MNMEDNFVISCCKLYGNNFRRALETGEAGILHRPTISTTKGVKKPSNLMPKGKFEGQSEELRKDCALG